LFLSKGFINVFGRGATGFYRYKEKLFELNFLMRKTFFEMFKPEPGIILTATQFAQFPTFNKTPVYH